MAQIFEKGIANWSFYVVKIRGSARLITQRSDGVFDLKSPPRLSFHLPLLFLMDNPVLSSKWSDFFVWNKEKWFKFQRTIFYSIFITVFRQEFPNVKRFCLFLLSDMRLTGRRLGARTGNINFQRAICRIYQALSTKSAKIFAPPCWAKIRKN